MKIIYKIEFLFRTVGALEKMKTFIVKTLNIKH